MRRQNALTPALPRLLHGQAMWALMICSAVRRIGRPMNQYGQRARAHWEAHRPEAFAQLDDPETFFTELGEEIATQISDLIPQLAGPDLPGEGTLEKVARLNSARARATEIALEESGLFAEAELTRQEWEATTQEHETGLIDWAWRMQAQTEGLETYGLTFEEAARRYLLPIEFLEQMARSTSPLAFLDEPANQAEWRASIERRWERDRAAQRP